MVHLKIALSKPLYLEFVAVVAVTAARVRTAEVVVEAVVSWQTLLPSPLLIDVCNVCDLQFCNFYHCFITVTS